MNNEIKNIILDYDKFLNILGKSEKTIDSYIGCITSFLKSENINTIDEFIDINIEFWFDYIERKKLTHKISSINKMIMQISVFYNFLIVSKGCDIKNYCKMIPKIIDNKPLYKENVMPNSDAEKLLNLKFTKIDSKHTKFSNNRDELIINILIRCGLRINELSNIKLKDIILDENKIYIRGKGYGGEISRYVNTSDKIKELIIESINYNPNREYLFVNYNGIKLSTSAIRSVWYKACDMCNIPRIHPHECRHFLGTRLVEKGVDIQDVKKVLGHSPNSSTARTFYIRDNSKDLNEITSVIDIF